MCSLSESVGTTSETPLRIGTANRQAEATTPSAPLAILTLSRCAASRAKVKSTRNHHCGAHTPSGRLIAMAHRANSSSATLLTHEPTDTDATQSLEAHHLKPTLPLQGQTYNSGPIGGVARFSIAACHGAPDTRCDSWSDPPTSCWRNDWNSQARPVSVAVPGGL